MVGANTLVRQSASCTDVPIYSMSSSLSLPIERVAQILEWHVDLLDLVVLAQITDPHNSAFIVLPNRHCWKLRQITSNSAVIVM